jgi:hypothetical protein
MWTPHTAHDGQPVAQCTVCGANAHPALVGTDEGCARCTLDAMSKAAQARMANLVQRRNVRLVRGRKGQHYLTL